MKSNNVERSSGSTLAKQIRPQDRTQNNANARELIERAACVMGETCSMSCKDPILLNDFIYCLNCGDEGYYYFCCDFQLCVSCHSVVCTCSSTCCHTLNGVNGEATNTDDLDNADRVRRGKESKTNRWRSGLNARSGRMNYGPRPIDKALADTINAKAGLDEQVKEDEKLEEIDMCTTTARLYYKKKSDFCGRWSMGFVIGGYMLFCLLVLMCAPQSWFSEDGFVTYGYIKFVLFTIITTLFLYLIWEFSYFLRNMETRKFESLMLHDQSFAKLVDWQLRQLSNSNEIDFSAGDFDAYEEVTVSMKYIDALRAKHCGIRCNVNTVDVLMSSLTTTYKSDITMYYSIMMNSALVYYQERLRVNSRKEYTSHHNNIFPAA